MNKIDSNPRDAGAARRATLARVVELLLEFRAERLAREAREQEARAERKE